MLSNSLFKRMPAIITTEDNDITHQISHLKNAFGLLGEYSCEDGVDLRVSCDHFSINKRDLPPHILISMYGAGLRAISKTLISRITDANRCVDQAALNSHAKQGKT